MGDVTGTRPRGNLRRALMFAGTLLAAAAVTVALADHLGGIGARLASGVFTLAVVLAPVAIIWLVGELHLRWSPPGRLARGLVGWTLVFACLALFLFCAPMWFFLLIAGVVNLG